MNGLIIGTLLVEGCRDSVGVAWLLVARGVCVSDPAVEPLEPSISINSKKYFKNNATSIDIFITFTFTSRIQSFRFTGESFRLVHVSIVQGLLGSLQTVQSVFPVGLHLYGSCGVKIKGRRQLYC